MGTKEGSYNMGLFSKKVKEQKRENSSFIIGVQDVFHLKDSQNLVVVGSLKGTVCVGDAVYISNPCTDDEAILLTTIEGIEIGPNITAREATDRHVALCINNGRQHSIRKSTVLFTRDRSVKDVHDTYISALGDVFVIKQNLDLSDGELEALTITDCAEIWRLFTWFHTKDESEEIKKENYRKIDRLASVLCKKIMHAESIYCVFNKNTGEPHMFSRTVNQGDGTYMCTPPNIRIFTKSYESVMKNAFSEDMFEIRPIDNGEEGNGVFNFFGSAFYLNGACGVEVLYEQTPIDSSMLVPAPDYSNIEKHNIPITNPELMRWMLLIGQMGQVQGEDGELIYKLYYRFLSKEMVKANFLIPMQKEGDIPQPDENGMTILKKDMLLKFPTMDGKDGRSAVRMFTDWKRLRMVYDEGWDGMVQPIEGMIDSFDCVINSTQYPQAGCYIGKEMFEEMKNI